MLAILELALVLAGSPTFWPIPRCARSDHLLGHSLALPLPSDVAIRVGGNDVDFSCSYVFLARHRITACFGPNYTDGQPASELRANAVSERLIRFPGIPRDWSYEHGPRDVKGATANGKHWRYIGQVAESISYEGASVEAAAQLDAVMDRLCWAQPEQE